MFPEMMMDPYLWAQMAQGITANPGVFADAMAGTGMLPPPVGGAEMFQPGMAPVMGASLAPQMPGAQPPMPAVPPGNPTPGGSPAIAGSIPPVVGPDPFGGTPTLGASLGGPGGMPMMSPSGVQPNDPMAALRAAGRGAPQGSMDQKPIMSGGISGAGKAPDAKAGKGASGEMQLLMQLLGGGSAPVPGLGQLLGAGIR